MTAPHPAPMPTRPPAQGAATTALVFGCVVFFGWVATMGTVVVVMWGRLNDTSPGLSLPMLVTMAVSGLLTVLAIVAIIAAIVAIVLGAGRGRAVVAIVLSAAGPVVGIALLVGAAWIE